MALRTPATSRHFSAWTNPANGAVSHILTTRIAPVQQSFYYTHPAWTDDGRHLWFHAAFPPPGGRHAVPVLALVDFETDELRVFPETQLGSSRAWIDHATGQAYWCNNYEVWRRGPLPGDAAERVGAVPAELVRGLRLISLATHPTFTPDKSRFNLDLRLLRSDGVFVSIIGDMSVADGEFRLWCRTDGKNLDHALGCPNDPELQIIAHEYWDDALRRGEAFDGTLPYHRIWLARPGKELEPLLREPVSHSGHEWWDADGRHIWYLHYGVGVKKVSLATREETLVWPGSLSHAHSSRDGRLLVADAMALPDPADCRVHLREVASGREITLVDRGPLARELTQIIHLHPHPCFCLHDRYVCYTTTVHDRVDVALTEVAPLLETTR